MADAVAVIIVNWNAGDLLDRCLTAVARQTRRPRRVIVVDNASTDGSVDGLETRHPGVEVVRNSDNAGFAAANNHAVRLADDCAWIALLNPDAFPEPTWLEQLGDAAARETAYAFFASRLLLANDPDHLDGVGDSYSVSGLGWRRGHGQPAAEVGREAQEVFGPCAAGALYRRDAFLQAGGFDEMFFCYFEDMDLAFRLRLLGHRCLYVPEAVAHHVGTALTGRRSDFSVYHGHRNLVWTFVKDMPAGLLLLYLPLHLGLNLFSMAHVASRGQAAVILRAKWDALRGLPRAWRARRVVQATRKASVGESAPRDGRSVRAAEAMAHVVSTRASVVTVNFNGGALLAESVASALSSTVPVEVIVVDNGSTDDSLQTLRDKTVGDARVRIVENGGNLGFATANNQALPYAHGEYLLFLNPDCLVQPDTIEKMAAVMDARPDVGMAGCLVLNPDGSEQAGCRRNLPTPGRAFLRAFGLGGTTSDFVLRGTPLPTQPTPVEAISGSFMFVRRAALDAVGPLDEGYFLHCEDLDWCARFLAAGQVVLFVPGISVVHHQGECSRRRPVRVSWHKHRGMARFYRKFLRDRYPRPLLWLVLAGIALRFVLFLPVEALRGLRAR